MLARAAAQLEPLSISAPAKTSGFSPHGDVRLKYLSPSRSFDVWHRPTAGEGEPVLGGQRSSRVSGGLDFPALLTKGRRGEVVKQAKLSSPDASCARPLPERERKEPSFCPPVVSLA